MQRTHAFTSTFSSSLLYPASFRVLLPSSSLITLASSSYLSLSLSQSVPVFLSLTHNLLARSCNCRRVRHCLEWQWRSYYIKIELHWHRGPTTFVLLLLFPSFSFSLLSLSISLFRFSFWSHAMHSFSSGLSSNPHNNTFVREDSRWESGRDLTMENVDCARLLIFYGNVEGRWSLKRE